MHPVEKRFEVFLTDSSHPAVMIQSAPPCRLPSRPFEHGDSRSPLERAIPTVANPTPNAVTLGYGGEVSRRGVGSFISACNYHGWMLGPWVTHRWTEWGKENKTQKEKKKAKQKVKKGTKKGPRARPRLGGLYRGKRPSQAEWTLLWGAMGAPMAQSHDGL